MVSSEISSGPPVGLNKCLPFPIPNRDLLMGCVFFCSCHPKQHSSKMFVITCQKPSVCILFHYGKTVAFCLQPRFAHIVKTNITDLTSASLHFEEFVSIQMLLLEKKNLHNNIQFLGWLPIDMQKVKLHESVSGSSGQMSIQIAVNTWIAVDNTKAGTHDHC